MSTEITKPIPKEYVREAIWTWTYTASALGVAWLLTYFPMGLLVAYFSKPMTNIHGESEAVHSDKYKAQGSSGKWKFLSTTIPFIRWWANLEDGQAGEPSGKWSAERKGKEYTFMSKYKWALRNPFNEFKRTSRFFACFVNDCVLEYWGVKELSDKNASGQGSNFVRAVDKTTGKVYYGYRKVVIYDTVVWYLKLKDIVSAIPYVKKLRPMMDNKLYQATFGFKIKPTHIGQVQDSDDLDKAFTFRIQFWANIN